MAKITNILSSFLLFILILQLLPYVIRNGKDYYDDIFNLKTKVGLISFQDEINNAGFYIKDIKNFFEDDSIKAILLRIDAPGGAAGSSQVLYNEIMSYKKEHPKPVITLVNDICASGSYYIACASDHIICSPAAVIGSIGSYFSVGFKVKDFMEKHDIKYEIIQSGKYKLITNPFKDMTQEMRDSLQALSDDSYNQFKKEVAIRRKLSLNDADKWANGKLFTGKQAFELGLVDELGSEYNAIKKIRELALIEKDRKIDWIKVKGPSLYEKFMGSTDDGLESKTFMGLLADSVSNKILSLANPKMG